MGDAYIVRRGGGVDTDGLTADSSNVLRNKTFFGKGSDEPQIGSIPLRSAATIIPGDTNQTIEAGQYLNGAQIIKGDSNLLPKNIKSGVSLFGVVGIYGGIVKDNETSLTEDKDRLAATTVGGYALFAGGHNGITATDTVDAYDVNLICTTPPPLSVARSDLAATTVVGGYSQFAREYALFAGGHNGITATDTIDVYDAHLTHATLTLSVARSDLAATTVDGYALFAGGHNGITTTDTVDAYDRYFTRTTPTRLDRGRDRLAATTVGGYALFAGGSDSYDADGNNYVTRTVDAYDVNLTHTTPAELDRGKDRLAATTVGGYALFAGGHDAQTSADSVVAYDATLVTTAPEKLSQNRHNLAATTVNGYALFAGGIIKNNYDEDGYATSTVTTYKMSF